MQEPALSVIRLLCVQSMTDAGIKSNKYEFFKREIVQVSPQIQSPFFDCLITCGTVAVFVLLQYQFFFDCLLHILKPFNGFLRRSMICLLAFWLLWSVLSMV